MQLSSNVWNRGMNGLPNEGDLSNAAAVTRFSIERDARMQPIIPGICCDLAVLVGTAE
jgi:hypothetical protein